MKRQIIEEISAHGPIPFERFMELALYDVSGGFFATGPVRSQKAGDFLTSPEVSSAFGHTLGQYVADEFERLRRPSDFTLIEMGAGSGSLMEPLLRSLSFEPRVVLSEASPAARNRLRQRFPSADVRNGDLDVLGDIQPEGGLRGVILANELLDNLPMALVVRDGDGWSERWVGSDGDDLQMVSAPVRAEVERWADAHAGLVPDEGIVEVQLAATQWLRNCRKGLGGGSVVVVDYGDTAELLESRRATGTIRTYRAHHLGPHPLDEPGDTDITADVNFSALLATGHELGFRCRLERQDDFLRSHGLKDRLDELRRQELDLARGDHAMARLRVRSEVTEIETILHPRGLGDFRVLVCEL